MKLTLQTSDLTKALSQLKPLAGGKATLPILGSVLLRAEGETLHLSTTDLDLHLTLSLPAQVEQEGATAVSCSLLASAVSRIEGDDLRLEATAKGLSGVAGTMRFRLITFDPAEFPGVPQCGTIAHTLALESGSLAKAIARVLPCVSTDESRYVLNGAHFTVDAAEVRVVATDGRRLAVTTLASESPSPTLAATVPARALKLLTQVGVTRLAFAESYAVAEAPGWLLVTKLIEGNFPQWKQVVPELASRRLTVDRKQFLEALSFAEVVCSEKSLSVVLELAGSVLRVSANGPDIGETSVEIPATIKGGKLKVAYNPDFLVDALSAVDGTEVVLSMADEIAPARVDKAGTTLVLMPMRIS